MSALPDERETATTAPASLLAASLYERYHNEVYAYCRHRLRNREEAEDATQATFLKAFTGFRNGSVPQVENAWLFTIAKRVVLSRLEVTDRLRGVETKGDVDSVKEERGGPLERAEMDDLWKAVEALPDTPRRAFLMREWQGLQYEEIAHELGLERSHVGVILLRARRRVVASVSNSRLLSLGSFGSISGLVRRVVRVFSGGGSHLAMAMSVAASPVIVIANQDGHATAASVARPSSVTAGSPVARDLNPFLRIDRGVGSQQFVVVLHWPTTPLPEFRRPEVALVAPARVATRPGETALPVRAGSDIPGTEAAPTGGSVKAARAPVGAGTSGPSTVESGDRPTKRSGSASGSRPTPSEHSPTVTKEPEESRAARHERGGIPGPPSKPEQSPASRADGSQLNCCGDVAEMLPASEAPAAAGNTASGSALGVDPGVAVAADDNAAAGGASSADHAPAAVQAAGPGPPATKP